ncbi:methyltransferase [Diaporthe helianthi]|uniref:Methyltransferase n=1 Tax=Diaporthe helianthi TaxID=158607 RepID=A0A2P5HJ42_DIAHE|nr:methyltransferase [Diaporthe helianthi]
MAQANSTTLPNAKEFYSDAKRIGSKDKSVGWYNQTFSGTPADIRQLLEGYSRIQPSEVDAHVCTIRDKAWDIFPFPCVGQFKFLTLSLYKLPAYQSMLNRLKQGAQYLDIGCCLGQDLRKLVADGAPPENLHGAELWAAFIDLSYELFKDQDLSSHLFQADALNLSDKSSLAALKGKMDFIHLGMILHVFNLEKQQVFLENCVSLLKPEPGCLIVGTAVGDVEGTPATAQNFMHSDSTFREMWSSIGKRTGLNFSCRVSLDDGLAIPTASQKHGSDRARRLVFEVERL